MSFACLCTKTFVETYTSIPSCHSSKHGSRANLGDGNVIRASRYAIKCYMTTDFTAYSRVYFLSVLRFYSVDWLVDNSPRRPPILPHTLWDLWWTKWQWDNILCKYSVFLSVLIVSVLRIYHSAVSIGTHCRPQFRWNTVAK